jgi:hypothetical protein
MLNIAVFAPIPTARIRITTAEKPGFRAIMRSAYRMSERNTAMIIGYDSQTVEVAKNLQDCEKSLQSVAECAARDRG